VGGPRAGWTERLVDPSTLEAGQAMCSTVPACARACGGPGRRAASVFVAVENSKENSFNVGDEYHRVLSLSRVLAYSPWRAVLGGRRVASSTSSFVCSSHVSALSSENRMILLSRSRPSPAAARERRVFDDTFNSSLVSRDRNRAPYSFGIITEGL